MALNFNVRYPGVQSTAPDANYTYGSAKNVTTGAGVDGTPGEKDWLNDSLGFQQRLLLEASITPSGNPDTILASDYYDALIKIILREMGSSSVRSFATVAAMVAATDLNVGDVIITEGYLAIGVGGAIYQVVASGTGTPDGGEYINLASHQAQLIPEPVVRSSQYGAVGDGSTDDSTEIQALIDAFKIVHIDTNSQVDTTIDLDVVGKWHITISQSVELGAITKGFNVIGTNNIFDFIGGGEIIGDNVTSGQIGIDIGVAGALTQVLKPTVSGCLGKGIQIAGLGCAVENANISGATETAGIYVTGSTTTGVSLTDCICASNADGIIVESADYTRIVNPDCTANSASGIRLQPSGTGVGDGPEHTTIIAARCTGNTGASDAGIFIQEDCNFTNLYHPICTGNTGNGINLSGISGFEGENIRIDSAVCNSNTVNGMSITRSKNLEVNNLTANGNTVAGVRDTDNIDIKFLGGQVDSNGSWGIRVNSSVTVLQDGLTITNNGDVGIFITDGGALTPGSFRTINCHFESNTTNEWATSGAGLGDAKAYRCTGDFVTEQFLGLIVLTHGTPFNHGLSGVPESVIMTSGAGRFMFGVTAKNSTQVFPSVHFHDGTTSFDSAYVEVKLFA